MNRTELADRLAREGTPDALYDIPGVHRVPIQLDAYYVLRPEGDDWLVLLRQRGEDTVLARVPTEADACDSLYGLLARAPSPAPDAAERIAQALSHTDEIQAEAWEDFERAVRRADDDGPGDESTRGET